jgi:hypothetical protein
MSIGSNESASSKLNVEIGATVGTGGRVPFDDGGLEARSEKILFHFLISPACGSL